MAVLNKADFAQRIQDYVGSANDENALSFIEDMTDTFNSLETSAGSAGDWEKKYNDLSNRYKERFLAGVPSDNNSQPTDEPSPEERAESVTYSDLFTNKN